jgi:hypothetical protein
MWTAPGPGTSLTLCVLRYRVGSAPPTPFRAADRDRARLAPVRDGVRIPAQRHADAEEVALTVEGDRHRDRPVAAWGEVGDPGLPLVRTAGRGRAP